MWQNKERAGSAAAADELLADVDADDWGQVGVSPYETGRLVALAPWLAGHQARLEFLCRRQSADGGWGGPDGYAVVPTLSATAGLLAQLRRGLPPGEQAPVVRAVGHGLGALRRWLDPETGLAVPDTVAVELIVPALVDDLNELLSSPDPALRDTLGVSGLHLPLPKGFDRRPLAALRDRFSAGALPQASWACLELFGGAAVRASFVRPVAGAVSCSAAATATWLGGPNGDRDGVAFLETLQARSGGPVPTVTPISYFEPAWVLNSLDIGGLSRTVPRGILDRLDAGLTATGAPASPGLPHDADDTAAVLTALLRHGNGRAPDSLLGFKADGYFTCFPSERNPSVSTNAHVLEALALYLARRPADGARFAVHATTAAQWLQDHQNADGSWQDKWHASAYYATACCVLALTLHGGAGSREAIDRAAAWVIQAQRPDGSWGQWQGTVEETAYAVQILALSASDAFAVDAIKRGCAFLADPPPLAEHPPLWHGKDLYMPIAVVKAARLAALHMGLENPGYSALTDLKGADSAASAPAPVAASSPSREAATIADRRSAA
jgi:Squalene-hopene cyclase C-terminal domain/Prenyltransferase and squalene oxidase repeat